MRLNDEGKGRILTVIEQLRRSCNTVDLGDANSLLGMGTARNAQAGITLRLAQDAYVRQDGIEMSDMTELR